MAKLKTPTPVGGINLTNLGESLQVQQQKVITRQETERQVLDQKAQATAKGRRDALAINDQARSDAQTIRDQQLEVLNGIYGQLDKAQTAMQLSDSDNPMDRLSLWFLQQSDPGYTRQGNLERINYLQSSAASLGDISVLQQAGYSDQISRVQELMDIELAANDDRLAVVSLAEKQGQELIDAEIAAQQTKLGVLQTNNAMQQNAMVNMTDDQIGTALQNAAQAPNQTVNVGGVDLTLAQLQARKGQIDERRYAESVMQLNLADMAISNMDQTQLQALHTEALGSKNRSVVIDGVKIPAGRIEDRIYQLNERDMQNLNNTLQLNNVKESLTAKTQQRILNTMNTQEIEKIIQNGFRDENGVAYDATMVRAARDQKYNDDQISITNQALVGGAITPVTAAAEKTQYVDSIIGALPANSPALSSLNGTKQTLQWAATLLNSDNPAQIETGQKLLMASDEKIQQIIAGEAKRLAAGDKEMELAYQHTLTGQAIPEDLVRGTLMERVKKGDYVGRWLTPEQNALFVSTYREAKYIAEQEAMLSGQTGNKDDIESAAAEQAVNTVLNSIAAPISDELMMMQASIPGNPVNGVMSTMEFATLMRNSDQAGIEAYLAANQTDEETAAKIRSGSLIPPGLVEAQNARLYMGLEKKRPGLGDAYAEWWGGEGRTQMVQQYSNAKMADAKNDFTKMSQYSLLFPHLDSAMGSYGNAFAQGKEDVYAAEIRSEHAQYITFGNNAQTKQVFLLEQTPGLTTQEKQIGMQQIIQPILDLGRASGIEDQAQMTQFVETQLRSWDPPNPQARRVLTKIMAGRDASLKVIDDFIGANTGLSGLWNRITGQTDLGSKSAWDLHNGKTSYGWYEELMKSGVNAGAPQPIPNRGMQ